MELPVYYATITDEYEGITTISLVDRPAVQSDFVSFSEEEEKPLIRFVDEEERKVMGCIMRCEFPIYRRNHTFGEFYLKYSKETIEKMTRKMLSENTGNFINLMHDEEQYVNGVTLEQVFIKNQEKGIVPTGFDNIADGSLFGIFKVENDEVWSRIKDGEFKGFSLEGYFSIDFNKKEEENMSLKEKLRNILAEYKTVQTTTVQLVAVDEIAVGSEVTDENGNPIPDGEYVTDEGITYIVKDGKVESINEPESEPKEEEPIVEEEQNEQPTEEPVEEEPTEEPTVEEEDAVCAEIEGIKSEIEGIKADILAIKEMLSKPASTPIEQEFKEVVEEKGDSPLISALKKMRK